MEAPSAAESYQIRISPEAFVVALGLFLGIAFLFAALRTYIRIQHNRRLYADDYFLFYAVIAAIPCAAVAYSIKEQVYLQIYVGLGWVQPAPDFYPVMLDFEKRIMACSALIWSIIYAIKFSFLAFFRKLVDRVYKFEVYWWVVVVITAISGITSIPLSFIICAHFGNDYMSYCPISSQLFNERIYMHTTTGLDILTDVLITSIPILLLWNVRISLSRKITLGIMLCLSTLCIIIAVIRTSLADLPVNGVIDTSWLVFWQGIEAAIAVIIVSCTALRGLFGAEGAFTRKKMNGHVEAMPGVGADSYGSENSSSSPASSRNNNDQEKKTKHSRQTMKSWYKYGGRNSGLDSILDELPMTWEPGMARSGSALSMRPMVEDKRHVVFEEAEDREGSFGTEDGSDDAHSQRRNHSRSADREIQDSPATKSGRSRGNTNSGQSPQRKALGYTANISAG